MGTPARRRRGRALPILRRSIDHSSPERTRRFLTAPSQSVAPPRMGSQLAQGESAEAILSDHSGLEPADINACLAYAHAVIAHDRIDRIAASG